FDVDGTLLLYAGPQGGVDVVGGGLGVFDGDGGGGDPLVDGALGAEFADAVVQQGRSPTLAQAGGAADDHHGRFLGVGAGHGVERVEPAHAVGDAQHPEAVDAGVGVGGEPGARFA